MLLQLIKVSEFMLLQNVERFRSQQEKEKSSEKICHDSLKLIDKVLSQQDNNARVQVLKDNVASKWCDLQEVHNVERCRNRGRM